MTKKILFVCMGNICRSPAAEGIAKKILEKKELIEKIEIDSAGTLDYHSGELPDPRMIAHSSKRGYKLNHPARQFNPAVDFDYFDYILTMDDEIFSEINSLDKQSKYKNKILKMADFSSNPDVTEVPDPYYSGSDGFELVLDILEDSVNNLVKKIEDDIRKENKKQD